jgi:hypothetical protein
MMTLMDEQGKVPTANNVEEEVEDGGRQFIKLRGEMDQIL